MNRTLSIAVAVALFSVFGSARSGEAFALGDGWLRSGGVVYAQPHRMRVPGLSRDAECCGLLTFRGGTVLYKPHAYLILWGYKSAGDPNGVAGLLQQFLGSVGKTAWLNTVTQYYGQNMRYPKNIKGMLAGVWDDETNAIPSSPTDAQVAAEAARSIGTFGFDRNGAYIVATAHNHNTSGFGTSFCGYHSAVRVTGGQISYTNLPYMPDAPICGSNKIQPSKDETAADEGVTIVAGHEFAESITDPLPVTGWWNQTYGELGDECAWKGLQNTPIGPYSFATQPLFSNASDSCVQSYP